MTEAELITVFSTQLVLLATAIIGLYKTFTLHKEVNSRLTELVAQAELLGYARGKAHAETAVGAITPDGGTGGTS